MINQDDERAVHNNPQSIADDDEWEIDLRRYLPYLLVLVRRWYVPVACALVVSLVFMSQAREEAPVYEATAAVAVIKSRTRVEIEPAVKTFTEDQLNSATQQVVLSDQAARRQTLVSLVSSGTIADAVVAKLGDQLPAADQQPGRLSRMVRGQIAVNKGAEKDKSDLIQIIVTHGDPQLAAKIADAWGEEYEKMINTLYGSPPNTGEAVDEDAAQAKQVYEEAQQSLVDFLTQSTAREKVRQVEASNSTLEILYTARQQAFQAMLDQEVEAATSVYGAYVKALTADQVLAIEKEQERKHGQLSAYIDAQSQGQTSAVSQAGQDRQRVLDDAYLAKGRLQSQLSHARTLRDQARAGGDPNSTAIALALLKAQVAGATAPADLTLQIQSISDLSPADLVADTDALVSALEKELATVEGTIKTQTALLLNDEGMAVGEPAADSALTQQILKQYPELFQTGELSKLGEEQAADSPLAQAAQRVAREMLSLKADQKLADTNAGDTAINQAISKLEGEVRQMEAEIEQDNGTRTELTKARDFAFETYSTLARKATEVAIASELQGTEVKFAARAAVPMASASPGGTQQATTGALYGLALGIVLAYALEFAVRRSRRPQARTAQA